jgi:electron-transferring-flavoprotein dehydrogenase
MLCAEAIAEELGKTEPAAELTGYTERFEKSWMKDELYRSRNFKPAMGKGLWMGTLLVGIDQKVFGGRAPWTLHSSKPDHAYLKPATDYPPIEYPKPDGKLTFDRLSSVFLSGTSHEENQPAHLTLKDGAVPVAVNLTRFAGPESRYCPAGVYEYLDSAGNPTNTPGDGARLQINAQNCVHCKTCDIKDPTQNIVWVTPEGGGGPNYSGM